MHGSMRSLGKLAGCFGLVILGWLAGQGRPAIHAQPLVSPRGAPAQAPAEADKNVVAYVNGMPITRQELADELLARKGKEQLQLLINRRIIEHACRQAGIKVTDAEVNQDLKEMMQAIRLPTEAEFEEKVLRQRHTTLFEYKEDVVRPAIAMRKLAGERIKVTDEDIQKAFEATYGEKVRCRVILIPQQDGRERARIHAEVKNDRDAFIKRATQQADPTLAAEGGVTKINRHSALENVEKEAFRLKDGDVSQVLQIPQGYVILLREGLEPADKTKKLEEVRDKLRKDIAEKKLRMEVPTLFKELRKQAVVRDYLNNKYDLKDVTEDDFMKNKKAASSPSSASTVPSRR